MNFKIRAFDAAADSEWYNYWWQSRGFERVPKMPAHSTVIEIEGYGPVAAGGLVLTDASYTIPDGICTNPDVPREIRQLAFPPLFSWFGEATLSLGYDSIFIMSSSPTILDHAIMSIRASKDLGWDFEHFEDYKILRGYKV